MRSLQKKKQEQSDPQSVLSNLGTASKEKSQLHQIEGKKSIDCEDKYRESEKTDNIEALSFKTVAKQKRRTGIGVRDMSSEEYRRQLYKAKVTKNLQVGPNHLLSEQQPADENKTSKEKESMRKRWSENKKEQRCRKKLIDEETFKFEIANKKRSERLERKMDN